jgi:hypothetical protein
MPIDDKYEAIERQYVDESNPIYKKLREVAGQFSGGIAFFNLIMAWFSPDAMGAKIQVLLDEIIIDIKRHEKLIGRTLDTSKIFESQELAEAVIAAMNESLRTADKEKIKRFAKVVSSGMTLGPLTKWEDVSAYIRDLSQLTEADLAVLRILYDFQARAFEDSGPKRRTDPNSFTQQMPDLMKALDERKISHDEFYSRCARLSGFGLTLEVQRNDGRYAPKEHCFRMTGRGYELMTMLIS